MIKLDFAFVCHCGRRNALYNGQDKHEQRCDGCGRTWHVLKTELVTASSDDAPKGRTLVQLMLADFADAPQPSVPATTDTAPKHHHRKGRA